MDRAKVRNGGPLAIDIPGARYAAAVQVKTAAVPWLRVGSYPLIRSTGIVIVVIAGGGLLSARHHGRGEQ